MKRVFYLLAVGLGLTLVTAATAHAEVCDLRLTDRYPPDPADHLVSTAYRECTNEWSGRLRRSGVTARIMAETALAPPPDFVSEVQLGLELADDALIKLGRRAQVGRRINVILASENLPGRPSADAYATLLGGICYLVILPNAIENLEPGATAFVMAHELFHCVQKATFPTLIENAIARGNLWWVEGSAHWFAHMAQPDHVVETYSRSANRFERESGRRPLREFHYPLWPFFAWYAQERGNARAVMEFLRTLPRGEHTDETIAGLLEPAEWQKFARDYSAYQIRVSHRVPVDPRPRRNLPETRIALPDAGDERTYSFNRRLAALDRYKIVLGPGDWELSSDAADPMFLSEYGPSGDPGPDWQEISQTAGALSLSVGCEDEKSFALVGLGTRRDIGRFVLTARKLGDTCRLSCSAPPPGHDMCLNGLWRETSLVVPGLVKDVISRGLAQARVENVEIHFPPPVVTFFPDTNTATVDITGSGEWSRGGYTNRLEITLGRSDATWGTSGNKLLICPKTFTMRGTMTLSGGGRSQSIPLRRDMRLDNHSPDGIVFEYSCDGATVTLRNAERNIDGRLER